MNYYKSLEQVGSIHGSEVCSMVWSIDSKNSVIGHTQLLKSNVDHSCMSIP